MLYYTLYYSRPTARSRPQIVLPLLALLPYIAVPLLTYIIIVPLLVLLLKTDCKVTSPRRVMRIRWNLTHPTHTKKWNSLNIVVPLLALLALLALLKNYYCQRITLYI